MSGIGEIIEHVVDAIHDRKEGEEHLRIGGTLRVILTQERPQETGGILRIAFVGGDHPMAAPTSAPPGATGSATYKPVPDGAVFVGTPKITSSDPNVVIVTDHGGGLASLQVNPAAAVGATCTITGSDDSFTDAGDFTVSAPPPPPPPAETGGQLTVTWNA